MSQGYASRLSNYSRKGSLGTAELPDPPDVLQKKIRQLAQWISLGGVVAHTGAGISTSAGIPDFRGPSGVWTMERKCGSIPEGRRFDEAIPTDTHLALLALMHASKLEYIVSQNVDGLHRRSGVPRNRLSELHGNMFIERCDVCEKEFERSFDIGGVGRRLTGRYCTECSGELRDTILDWEDALPTTDLDRAEWYSSRALLSITLGTSMQMEPAASIPLLGRSKRGSTTTYKNRSKNNSPRLVIINLQKTPKDSQADLVIRGHVDKVMLGVLSILNIDLPSYVRRECVDIAPISDGRFRISGDFVCVRRVNNVDTPRRRDNDDNAKNGVIVVPDAAGNLLLELDGSFCTPPLQRIVVATSSSFFVECIRTPGAWDCTETIDWVAIFSHQHTFNNNNNDCINGESGVQRDFFVQCDGCDEWCPVSSLPPDSLENWFCSGCSSIDSRLTLKRSPRTRMEKKNDDIIIGKKRKIRHKQR